jgi:hypothetical protein
MTAHRNRGAHGGEAPGLRECRRRIESLAGEGRFVVACARTGESPVPVAGLHFPDRRAAATAARLTAVYRAKLGAWDPETPWRDPVVHERRPHGPGRWSCGSERPGPDVPSTGGEP